MGRESNLDGSEIVRTYVQKAGALKKCQCGCDTDEALQQGAPENEKEYLNAEDNCNVGVADAAESVYDGAGSADGAVAGPATLVRAPKAKVSKARIGGGAVTARHE